MMRHAKSQKMDVPTVRMIHIKKRDFGWTQPELGRFFGLSVNQIGRILRGEAWPQVHAEFAIFPDGEQITPAPGYVLEKVAEYDVFADGQRIADEKKKAEEERRAKMSERAKMYGA